MVEVPVRVHLGEARHAYAGAHLAVPGGRLRALVTAGVPLYFIDGPCVAAHGAVGARFDVTSRLAVTLEAGVEYFFDVPDGYETLVFVPSLGARFLL